MYQSLLHQNSEELWVNNFLRRGECSSQFVSHLLPSRWNASLIVRSMQIQTNTLLVDLYNSTSLPFLACIQQVVVSCAPVPSPGWNWSRSRWIHPVGRGLPPAGAVGQGGGQEAPGPLSLHLEPLMARYSLPKPGIH